MDSINTPRLSLVPFTHAFANGLFELDSNPKVHRYLGNRPISTIQEAEKIIEFISAQYSQFGIGRWAVMERATGYFIGWAGLKFVTETVNHHSNYYDLGYRFIPKHWGKGYATECAQASIQYAADKLKVERLYAAAHVENLASNRVLQKVGFIHRAVFDYDGPHNWYCLGLMS